MLTGLGAGQVDIWFRVTEHRDEAEAAALDVLSDEERQQHARFVFARDRRDYAEAHALLRRSLSHYAAVSPRAWRFKTLPGGKPVLEAQGSPVAQDLSPALLKQESNLSFNLSHTHGLVACAIADGADVGIDVEATNRIVDPDVAARFFSAAENDDLRRCPPEDQARRFLELWTLKEAYVKAIGKGLAHPLNTIAFELNGDTIAFRPPLEVAHETWRFALFSPTPQHCLGLAVRASRATRIEARCADDASTVSPTRQTP